MALLLVYPSVPDADVALFITEPGLYPIWNHPCRAR